MAVRKRKPPYCDPTGDDGCAPKPSSPPAKTAKAIDEQSVFRVLKQQGVVASKQEQCRFVEFIDRSTRHRKLVKQRWAKNKLKDDDILRLIQIARDDGDLDEAIWRSFLAAHFGRSSANAAIAGQIESAAILLCGFGSEPKWAWNKVVARPKRFRNWLYDHSDDLTSLSFGNHRKYESHKPDLLWVVFESFFDMANDYGGPAGIVAVDADCDDQFHMLYRRLSSLHQFGRTGRFDFLVMLLDLGLISAEPQSCYLRGATGPRKGAVRLWGKRGIGELEKLAVELSERVGVSPVVVEDALCNWQK